MPRKALDDARDEVAEERDNAILRATLYARIELERMTPDRNRDMIAAAERQVNRRKAKLAEAEKLVELQARGRDTLDPLRADVARAEQVHELALGRARLFDELASMAAAENELDQPAGEPRDGTRIAERFAGEGAVPSAAKLRAVEAAFEKHFGQTLPVSARGATELHRSMGFDHTGRMDIGVKPDSKEGAWLRRLLETMRVPYLAFHGAVAGQSTAAHIHIGPPSNKIKRAD